MLAAIGASVAVGLVLKGRGSSMGAQVRAGIGVWMGSNIVLGATLFAATANMNGSANHRLRKVEEEA